MEVIRIRNWILCICLCSGIIRLDRSRRFLGCHFRRGECFRVLSLEGVRMMENGKKRGNGLPR